MFRRLVFVARMMIATLGYWRPKVWLEFWLGKRHEVVLKGVPISVRDNNYFSKIADLAMAWEVMVDNVYDEYPISANDIIVDIGGHIGSFSAKSATRAVNGKIYVCEPFPPTFNMLAKNVSAYSNVSANQIAISDRDGSSSLFYSLANPAENSLVRKTNQSTEVPMLTLGSFLDQNSILSVDLMKVDCEGAEYDILFAAKDQLHRIKKMVMEVHEPKYFGLAENYSIDGLLQLLRDSGFDARFERENKFQGYIYAHQR